MRYDVTDANQALGELPAATTQRIAYEQVAQALRDVQELHVAPKRVGENGVELDLA
ncbi:MAG: hypothetical protein M3O70_15750 [Actinomycetota bacterium]|nr:hypothetical protein [Actinomycetota bacterium]